MKVYLTHDWKVYQGVFTLTLVSFHYGFRTIGITVLNFAIEVQFT